MDREDPWLWRNWWSAPDRNSAVIPAAGSIPDDAGVELTAALTPTPTGNQHDFERDFSTGRNGAEDVWSYRSGSLLIDGSIADLDAEGGDGVAWWPHLGTGNLCRSIRQ
jgi:hypothetical protein